LRGFDNAAQLHAVAGRAPPLQSVPVLGFLTITVTAFIALFPGSELGLEAASIFAIFTAQAWAARADR
jgi:ABC-type anion transport system duplicated permease subunit